MYQCKSCGGELVYDITRQKLRCEHCDKKYDISDYPKEKESREISLNVFSCPNCGGEIYSNSTRIEGYCSYCGSETILSRKEGTYQVPKKIVPFKVTKKECEEAYLKEIKKIPLAPKEYQDSEAELEFRGIYVPFHTYDVHINGTMRFKGEIDRIEKAKKHKVDVYRIDSQISGKATGFPEDASISFPDWMSDTIVNGHKQKDTINFHPAYLSGFYADVADDAPVKSKQKIEDTARLLALDSAYRSADNYMHKQYKRTTILTPKKEEFSYEIEPKEDILVPVWFMSRKTKKRVSYTVMNGTSKDMLVDIPIDIKKVVTYSLITAVILFFILQWLTTFRPIGMVEMASFFNLILIATYCSSVKSLYKREINSDISAFSRFFGDHPVIGVLLIIIAAIFYFFYYLVGSVNGNPEVWMLVSFLAFDIVLLAFIGKKYMSLVKHGTHPTKWIIGNIAVAIATLIICYIKPVEDTWYYIVGILSLLSILITMYKTISDYNLLCSNPMPQFEMYKGGKNRAND